MFIKWFFFTQPWVMRLEHFTTENIKIMVFRNVTCSSIHCFRSFAAICRLHLQGIRLTEWETGSTFKFEVTDFSYTYYTTWRHIPNQHSNMCLRWLYRVSQEERAKLRESVPYVKLYRYNPKHLYPKLNGYGDNGHRKVWASGLSTYCTPSVTP